MLFGWTQSIRRWKISKVDFDILEDGAKVPVGCNKSSGHLVFDVRMTLERKARWVKDGHKTPEPVWSTFAGIVSRESVRIALTHSTLNDLPVSACDIQNFYVQAPSSEKHYVVCGPEFGLENVGKHASAMEEMGSSSCKADPEVWIRPALKSDGVEYYQHVLLYTDDILAIMEEPEKFLREEIGKR